MNVRKIKCTQCGSAKKELFLNSYNIDKLFHCLKCSNIYKVHNKKYFDFCSMPIIWGSHLITSKLDLKSGKFKEINES
jgi:hypothetical protein